MTSELEVKPPFPPFDFETATLKVRKAEDAWNGKNPSLVAKAYTQDTQWRNRNVFLTGREAVEDFLKQKWAKEHNYRLIKSLWAFEGNKIAVRFAYEWHDDESQWFRSYGNENWEFSPQGLMAKRYASINDLKINESERLLTWTETQRPISFPSLDELGL